jgi:uncharacterized membrane protein
MRVKNLKAIHRLLVSIVMAIGGYWIATRFVENRSSATMAAWVIFCLVILTLDWITFVTTSPSQIRQQARVQDESAIAIFIIILLSILASLTGVFVIVVNREQGAVLPLIFGSAGMIASWCMMHTLFTVRYAHLYYGDHERDQHKNMGGLEFPDKEEKPDFLDFAYFSFVIGMTFQVSDVQIIDKRFRRLVLMHSIISFAFNTFIVALTINVIAGFSGR